MRAVREIFFNLFILLVFLSHIHEFLTVGIRRDKQEKVLYATRATREYQTHRISPRIQVNIRKILNFLFFSSLCHSSGQHFSDQLVKLLYATRATSEYQNHGISPDFHVK